MRTSTWHRGIICCMALAVFAGCQTIPREAGLGATPVVLRDDEQIIRDQLIILVDASGSLGQTRAFQRQKALVEAFVAAMPEGSYHAGLDSFAGVSSSEWVTHPLTPFNRSTLATSASALRPLGSLTPMARGILSQRPEMLNKRGRGALLVFSDGNADSARHTLDACRELKAAHGGDLCIYTVQIGSSERGRKLLQEMATVNGCGKYYDGATLDSAAAIQALAREILVGPGAPPPPAPAPRPAWELRNIYFDTDSAIVSPAYDGDLNRAAEILRSNPAMRIRLAGHTDSRGSDQYNQRLSERRVQAVKAALVARGVDASRLLTGAYGESQPAIPNTDAAAMQKNRRVELTVVD